MNELQYSYCPFCGEEITEFDLRYRLQQAVADNVGESLELQTYMERFQAMSEEQAKLRSKVFPKVSVTDIDFNDGGQPLVEENVYKTKYYDKDGEFQAISRFVDVVCGKCQNIVPFNMPHLKLFRIAVIGSYKTGKTTMLASLLHSLGGKDVWNFFDYSPILRGQVYDPADGVFKDISTNPTIYQYYQNMFERDTGGMFIPEVTRADDMPHPFLFNLHRKRVLERQYNNLCVTLYDIPGELFKEESNKLDMAINRIKTADALLWVVDPMNFPDISVSLGRTVMRDKSAIVASSYYTLIERIKSLVGNKIKEKKIALVLAKADVFCEGNVKTQLVDINKDNIIFGNKDVFKKTMTKSAFESLIEKGDNDIKAAFSSSVFRFSKNEEQGFAEVMAERLETDVKCFRASALGFDLPENEKSLPKTPEPYGLQEMFYWLLTECLK